MSASSLIAAGYGGYAGWGDTEADADFKATGGNGKKTSGSSSGGSSGGSTSSFYDDSAYKLALQVQQNAIQPVIQAYTEQINALPAQTEATKQNLESQKQPLNDRYDALLTELTRKEGVDTSSANLALSREYGKRGVALQSGAYDQALQATDQPISQYYAGLASNTNLQRETDLMSLAQEINNLPGEESQKKSDLELASALAQAGNSSAAAQILISMGASQNSANQIAAQLAQNASQFQQSQEQSSSQFSQTLAQQQADAAEQVREYNTTNSRLTNSANATSTTTAARQGAINMAASGASRTSIISKYGSQISIDDIDEIMSAYPTTKSSTNSSTTLTPYYG